MKEQTITLNVNGEVHRVSTWPSRRLLDVLREELGLGSVREGCGIGVCGACTVLVDGAPLSSCLLTVAQVTDKPIRTVEGLAQEGRLHPVQEAFVRHNAFQCAYCTPGFILLAVALIEREGRCTEELVQEYVGANLCRCGSYRNIVRAVREACAVLADQSTRK